MSANTRIGALIAAQVRAQRARLRLAALAGAVVSVAAVCLLGLSGWFITGAALAGLAGALAAQAFNYMMPSAIIRLLAILRTGARYIERVAGHEAALKALARLRPQLFDNIARGPVSRALDTSSGEVSARLVQDVDAVQTLFVRLSAPWSLGAGAAAAVILAALASPLAGGLLLLVMAVACLGCVLIARRLAEPAGREVQVAVGALKDRLSALEAVAPELKAYALDDWATQEVATVAARHDDAVASLARAGGWIAVWQACMTATAVGGVVLTCAGAPAPLVALAALATVMGMDSAAGLAGALHQNGAAQEAMARLDRLLEGGPAKHETKRPVPTLVLTRTASPLAPPARIAIFGPSGSGKTTLVERLIGLREIEAGVASLAGADSALLTPPDRRALFAYAAQDVRLIDGTIRQNLLISGPADDDTLWAALEDAGLADRVRADAWGLDAPIGSNGQRLSGGERRRLGLARAYLRDAPWLILDEPTEGLDVATEARVLASLDRRLRAHGQGLILVSHRSSPLALCEHLHRIPEDTGGDRTGTAPAPAPAAA
ncbi:amino acid ABC transporter ATP-binding/permease protein [Brevundimonas staleyi]|uniref:Amino acid ABC transporter ATP-binding/permease protein n=1 Tax=Brevundimonas staleyi TaxID=74326 RepID=A0ABW0FVJ4_9CAUL